MILGRPKVEYNVQEQGRGKMLKYEDPYGEGGHVGQMAEQLGNWAINQEVSSLITGRAK